MSRFTRALVCPPAATFAAGLTTSGLGAPDPALAMRQHDAYCRALERLGVSLVRVPPDPGFPDSTFVEDTAVVAAGAAILARPGAPSRAGEVAAVERALRDWFPSLEEIVAPGTVEGGDVCEAGRHVLIGVSERTNAEGARQLAAWLGERGLGSSVIDIRGMPGLLHLKTGLSWLGGRAMLARDEIAGHEALRGWEVTRVPSGEEYAANCLMVNDTLLHPRGYPCTAALLRDAGRDLVELDMSEFRKMNGALTCLSVRW